MYDPTSSARSLPLAIYRRAAIVIGVACAVLAIAGTAIAAPPNLILSDQNLRASNSMSVAEIQAFLDAQPGPLKSLVTPDFDTSITVDPSQPNVNLTPDSDGVVKPASQIIWEACQQWQISPKVMLAMLQKEQSLLTRTSLTPTTLARAIGAGCPNTTSNKYPGFGNQMWHGARLLDGYGEGKNGSKVALYVPGMYVMDIYRRPNVKVFPATLATYKLYVYNPSIGGNTSFWNIYSARFGNPVGAASTRTRLSAPSSVRVKRTLKLKGTVSPGAAPGSVTITKTRLVGRKWKNAGTVRIDAVNGSYSYSFTPRQKGRWRFVAKYLGGSVDTNSYSSSKSPVKEVRVK